MPKRKANWWPPSILSDPDVLSVDDEGRFVLCKICHVHYAVHGGKKPKPVIMNSNFRTRAWDVHKERTNSHRLQKQQERLQQAKTQQQQQPQQAADSHTPPHQPQQQQQTQGVQGQQRQAMQPPQGQQQVLVSQAPPPPPPPQQHEVQASHGQTQARPQSQTMAALASQAQVLAQAPSRPVQGQVQTPAPLTPQQVQHSPSPSLRLQNEAQVLHQQRRQHLQQQQQQQQRRQLQERELDEETKEPAGDSARNSPIERPASTASPDAITAVAMSGANSVQSNGGVMNNSAGKRPAPAMPAGAPVPIRRRVFRAGSPGSSMQLLAESEAVRRQNAHAYERHSLMAAGAGNHGRRAAPSEHAMAMEQADSSARWRHMHDDVSRALNRRRPQGPASYTSGELRAAKTLAQTETGDLGGNNSERVAKKLQSLNAEYQASTMRHADAYNMRHTDVFDRRSAGYKEYWGTLRNVYASSGPASGGAAGNVAPFRKSHHRSSALAKPAREESKETEADSTTPDDSGSSEDAFKPTVIVHDASLINAIERLTDATSSQIANLYQRQASDTREALAGLTSVMTDLRVQHGNAFERIIELQEKHLKVMESILEIKLRKEAARNAKSASSSNGSTSESSSGSSPGSSSNGAGSTTS